MVATKQDEKEAPRKAAPVTTDPNIVSVAPTPDEQRAYLKEQERLRDEVGEYERAAQDEMVEKLRQTGQLPPVINPDSRLPHLVSKEHGQIAPPNQNPTGRCVVCGDPLAYGQNFVCRAHTRAG